MIQLIPRIPAYKMFRQFGFPRLYPLNLTISVTYGCNSRCRTCNIYKNKVPEFTLEEFEKTFRSIGTSPYWMTMSGGEPFLRGDIVDICKSAYDNCHPSIINIPTNGILSDRIPERVKQIAQYASDADIIINVSIDEIGERHDEIRNVRGNFNKAVETFRRLKQLGYPNVTVGIHTVISKYNVNNMDRIYEELQGLNPDSYITEIAEERVELGTVGQGITPSLEDYSRAIDMVSKRITEREYHGISAITQGFRAEYYELVKKTLKEKRQIIPCYAGIISAQIAPDGEVWACCIKAESMGNLRQADYDFKRVWFSDEAQRIREPIRAGRCFCPLANASYTNMLVSFSTMARVLKNILQGKMGRYLSKARHAPIQ